MISEQSYMYLQGALDGLKLAIDESGEESLTKTEVFSLIDRMSEILSHLKKLETPKTLGLKSSRIITPGGGVIR